MKKLLAATFVALLMVGCGEDSKKPTEDSPESNASSAETPPAKSPAVGGIDLDDKETLDGIIAEAIDYKKLQRRGKELLYAPNEQTPYSGWIKMMHDNGQVRWLIQIKDGRRDGLSTQYFWSNGQKIEEATYKDGQKDGLATEWYKDGQKKLEVNWKDGEEDGLMTRWYEDGQKQGEVNFKDGEADGLMTRWYEDGQKQGEVNWKDGKRDGRFTGWYEDGQKQGEGNFKDGEEDGLLTGWHPNGQKKSQLDMARTTAQSNLKTVFESLAQKTRYFPMAEDVGSVEKFVVWWRNKTKDTRPDLWFIGEDEELKDLAEDSDGPGIPANIPDDAANFEADQVKALGYCVALPGNDADTRSFLGILISGAYPIMWSRGLDAGDDKWSPDGAWGGEGGHVLFSDGTARWYDDTKGKDDKGVFTKAINNNESSDKKVEPTYNIKDALPAGWQILMVGCGDDGESGEDSPESNQTSAETTPAKTDSSAEGKPFTIADLSMEMLWVKPGTFDMGSPLSEKDRQDRETPHSVTLTDGYWLGKHEVTQSQWEKVMGSNPSFFKGGDKPVETVSWTEVTSFCNKLTASERRAGRLPAGMTYQLPTEAQWEYACRAGTKTAFSFGDSLTSGQANTSSRRRSRETTDVGKYPANGWGFHDMHGNVWEWCADWYGDYPTGAARDPVGPAGGSDRVRRGGSWSRTADRARSAVRRGREPAVGNDYLGFRLSLRPAGEAEPQVQVPEKPRVAVSVKAGTAFTIRDLGLDLLWVKPGAFEMGSPRTEAGSGSNESIQTVTLTEGFWLGKHEVTQSQWEKVMGSNPSHFKGANRPVGVVSWTDVTSFCDKLTALERKAGRLPAGMAYQLPTEAQWEYACRAGTKTAFSFGDSLTSDQANISGGPGETTAVGKYPANGWGFHDMHGNVFEWCADWYGDYQVGAARDPVGPAVGSYRVTRGGSWDYTANYARPAYRPSYEPAYSYNNLGFRLSLRPASK